MMSFRDRRDEFLMARNQVLLHIVVYERPPKSLETKRKVYCIHTNQETREKGNWGHEGLMKGRRAGEMWDKGRRKARCPGTKERLRI